MFVRVIISIALLLIVSAAAVASPDPPVQAVEGYRYTLHTAQPAAEELGQFPPRYTKSTLEHVMQGPEHTLIWRDKLPIRNVGNASFAMGEQQMGLYIPHWPRGKSADEASGWDEYGKKLSYSSFNVTIDRGEGEREIAGGTAEHYVLTADYSRRLGDEPGSSRNTMHADLWILPDMPFSWAPFHTPGAYADPRFAAAIASRLDGLGMVVRSDARYSSVGIDDDGEPTGMPREGTWTSWITDLEPARVPVVDIPVGDRNTLTVLQDEFRKDPDDACEQVMGGKTPGFVQQNLDADQQAAVLVDLHKSCKSHTMRVFGRTLTEDPQSVCGGILDGNTPDVVSQVLDEGEQKEFMRNVVPVCEGQVIDR